MKRPGLRYDDLSPSVQYKLRRRHLRNGHYGVMKITATSRSVWVGVIHCSPDPSSPWPTRPCSPHVRIGNDYGAAIGRPVSLWYGWCKVQSVHVEDL
ncbi:hypothetical protein PIB30_026067 [Stylosanthes scabra]|uniref:Uncharacterized protein n=1 Tax=Stylosanthes scabra TaxID=79078 RepID=A0ABU6Y8Z5_9FABA|nr:hypothetical protein [Stylosanthes scabra]